MDFHAIIDNPCDAKLFAESLFSLAKFGENVHFVVCSDSFSVIAETFQRDSEGLATFNSTFFSSRAREEAYKYRLGSGPYDIFEQAEVRRKTLDNTQAMRRAPPMVLNVSKLMSTFSLRSKALLAVLGPLKWKGSTAADRPENSVSRCMVTLRSVEAIDKSSHDLVVQPKISEQKEAPQPQRDFQDSDSDSEDTDNGSGYTMYFVLWIRLETGITMSYKLPCISDQDAKQLNTDALNMQKRWIPAGEAEDDDASDTNTDEGDRENDEPHDDSETDVEIAAQPVSDTQNQIARRRRRRVELPYNQNTYDMPFQSAPKEYSWLMGFQIMSQQLFEAVSEGLGSKAEDFIILMSRSRHKITLEGSTVFREDDNHQIITRAINNKLELELEKSTFLSWNILRYLRLKMSLKSVNRFITLANSLVELKNYTRNYFRKKKTLLDHYGRQRVVEDGDGEYMDVSFIQFSASGQSTRFEIVSEDVYENGPEGKRPRFRFAMDMRTTSNKVADHLSRYRSGQTSDGTRVLSQASQVVPTQANVKIDGFESSQFAKQTGPGLVHTQMTQQFAASERGVSFGHNMDIEYSVDMGGQEKAAWIEGESVLEEDSVRPKLAQRTPTGMPTELSSNDEYEVDHNEESGLEDETRDGLTYSNTYIHNAKLVTTEGNKMAKAHKTTEMANLVNGPRNVHFKTKSDDESFQHFEPKEALRELGKDGFTSRSGIDNNQKSNYILQRFRGESEGLLNEVGESYNVRARFQDLIPIMNQDENKLDDEANDTREIDEIVDGEEEEERAEGNSKGIERQPRVEWMADLEEGEGNEVKKTEKAAERAIGTIKKRQGWEYLNEESQDNIWEEEGVTVEKGEQETSKDYQVFGYDDPELESIKRGELQGKRRRIEKVDEMRWDESGFGMSQEVRRKQYDGRRRSDKDDNDQEEEYQRAMIAENVNSNERAKRLVSGSNGRMRHDDSNDDVEKRRTKAKQPARRHDGSKLVVAKSTVSRTAAFGGVVPNGGFLQRRGQREARRGPATRTRARNNDRQMNDTDRDLELELMEADKRWSKDEVWDSEENEMDNGDEIIAEGEYEERDDGSRFTVKELGPTQASRPKGIFEW